MCLFNLFSKDKDEKDDLPPPRPTSLGRRTPEATSRLQGSRFDGSPRPSGDKDKYGYGVGYNSGNGSLGVGGPHGGGLYGGVNGGVYSGGQRMVADWRRLEDMGVHREAGMGTCD
ncbi:hypothetical protein FPHYL_11587 [Fusarium phyllophilum]|uniref:Uncharacterized protein n=1 Tax=Fusarium phyllophilum TaxID=47803 RepID=A0A8H5MVD9_9HYPO|nr:hypothetical protein FPHYL_11587 [Fusarium phyllophilum]